jgi:cell volume regulation protein A
VTEPVATAALLAAIGILLALAGLVSPVSGRFGVPALVTFLALGVLAGSEGIGGIPFDDYGLAFRLGSIALVLILFDGGLNTSPIVFRRAVRGAGLLATLAVLLTALVMAGFGMLLGLPLQLALLIGAVVSSTDAAAVFSILRNSGVRLERGTAATLEVESGLNDPMALFLTIVATEIALGTDAGLADFGLLFVVQLVVGVLVGGAIGFGGRAILRVVRLPAGGLYPVLTVALAFLAFGVTTLLEGSGFLAVYLAAVSLAAAPIPYKAGVRRVHDALAWLSQILMFVMLGLLVFPSRLVPTTLHGLALAVALAFVARPLAVFAVLAPLRTPWREQVFIAWVGLRGAVPIVLATYPVLRGVTAGDQIFHLVFFVVLVNSLIPGASVAWLARRLGLGGPARRAATASVELVSLRELPGEFRWYLVSPASAVAEACVRDLALPEGCVVTLVVRGATVIAPRGSTTFLPGDEVCVFAIPSSRSLLDLLFGGALDDST